MVDFEEKLDTIATEIKSGTCVPFLGAAASVSSNGYKGPPTGTQLAKELADECGYPDDDTWNLPRVAQFYEYKEKRKGLVDRLVGRILPYSEPSPIHILISQIAKLGTIRCIITTNYDRLMEIALDRAGVAWMPFVQKPVDREAQAFFPPRGFSGPVLYKMHGTIQEPETVVITEDDYIEFLAALRSNDQGIPSNIPYYFTQYFSTCTLLFVGYGLEDWNFKVLFKGLIEKLPRHLKPTSYAIQKYPSDFLEHYWKQRGIEILYIDVYEFAHKLAEKLGVGI